MNVLITGSNGFIGKNLKISLEKLKRFNIIDFNREHSEEDLLIAVKKARDYCSPCGREQTRKQ